ncbi:MAG: transporter, partial [Chromatiaceae bacterium]|nr:transporter [Chromatiaceae bacterium]
MSPHAIQSDTAKPRRRSVVLLSLLLLCLNPLAAAAASLAEAVASALVVQQQEARIGALRGEQAAVDRQAAGPLAADPALRAKTLSDALTGDDGAYELEALVDLPL